MTDRVPCILRQSALHKPSFSRRSALHGPCSWSAVLCPEAVRDSSRSRKRPVPAAQEAALPSSSGKPAAGGMTMEAKLNSVLAGESTGWVWCQLGLWVLASEIVSWLMRQRDERTPGGAGLLWPNDENTRRYALRCCVLGNCLELLSRCCMLCRLNGDVLP